MNDVLLLAGGESTRFWPFSSKNTTPFFGKPLLFWHYEQLVRLGCKRVVVVTNSETDEPIRNITPPKKLAVEYVVQTGSGQVQAVLSGSPSFGINGAIILNASDIYEDALLKEIDTAVKKEPTALIVGAMKVAAYFPGGYLKLNDDGSILEIIEKPKPGKEPSDLVNLGIQAIPNMQVFSEALKHMKRYAADGYERAMNKYMKKEAKGIPIITTTRWLYLKYPWHMLSVMDMCLETIQGQYIDKTVKIGKFVTIEGPVIIEKDVKISEGTKIVGPVFIGEGTVIGNNNIVRYSHIGHHCVTGFSTDITRSYIGNNSWFHTNYVGDSAVGNNVSMGSGTVLANLRLDESMISSKVKGEPINTRRSKLGAMIGNDVRIGVNVSTMPGTKIGSNCFVGAGVVLAEDLQNGMYCRVTPTVVITENKKHAQSTRDEFRKKL